MLPLCGIGFQNALGALPPPEVAVRLEWNGQIRVNAAEGGMHSVSVSDPDPDASPDWVVIGLCIPLWTENDAPGNTADAKSLFEEGCAEVYPVRLLESLADNISAALAESEFVVSLLLYLGNAKGCLERTLRASVRPIETSQLMVYLALWLPEVLRGLHGCGLRLI